MLSRLFQPILFIVISAACIGMAVFLALVQASHAVEAGRFSELHKRLIEAGGPITLRLTPFENGINLSAERASRVGPYRVAETIPCEPEDMVTAKVIEVVDKLNAKD